MKRENPEEKRSFLKKLPYEEDNSMKKKNLMLAVFTVLMLTAGCAAQGKKQAAPAVTAGTETTGAEAAGAEETGAQGQAQSGEKSVITGTISDIKSFMFVITDKEGHEYVLTFEQGKEPDGLSAVKDGDQVTVTYTGELNEADAFTGTVISVEK